MRCCSVLLLGFIVAGPAEAQTIAPPFHGSHSGDVMLAAVEVAAPMPKPTVERNIPTSAPAKVVSARSVVRHPIEVPEARRATTRSDASYRERSPSRGRDTGRFWPPVF